MTSRLFKRLFPYVCVLVPGTFAGCGGEAEIAELQQLLTETKAGQIVQADFDRYTTAVDVKGCSFAVAGGTATFTPSNALSQALYGDPNGAAHKSTFAVPPISSPAATVDIKSLEAEMANTGIKLSGSTLSVKLAFHGQLRIVATLPVFGKLSADLMISSSNLTANLGYDKATARANAQSVKATFSIKTKNCGGSGWCNGIMDAFIKSSLPGLVETPLRDMLNKQLNDPDVTEGLEKGLGMMYNAKDPKPTKWSLVKGSLELTSSAFRFNVSRTTP